LKTQIGVVNTSIVKNSKNEEVVLKDPITNDLHDSVKARCIEISPDDKYCACGFKDGTIIIYSINKSNVNQRERITLSKIKA